MELAINKIKLKGESDFVKAFNYCSELYAAWCEQGLSIEEETKRWNAYFDAKYALETGNLNIG